MYKHMEELRQFVLPHMSQKFDLNDMWYSKMLSIIL